MFSKSKENNFPRPREGAFFLTPCLQGGAKRRRALLWLAGLALVVGALLLTDRLL
jgi:hypothetical protein